VVATAFCLPALRRFDHWGQNSWDQYLMWAGVQRRTIVEYGQVPLWNPWEAGGNVMLAHPHSSFLSPTFAFVLAFGELHGLKIQIPVHFFLGLLGTFALCRHEGLRRSASAFCAFVFLLGAYLPLHVAEGHASYLVIGFVPWALLFLRKSFRRARWTAGSVIALSLMFLGGSVYVFLTTVLFLSCLCVFWSLERRSLVPVKRLALLLLGTGWLCAVKAVPLASFLADHPRVISSADGVGGGTLAHMLLNRSQVALDMLDFATGRLFGVVYHWHEYGAYVGLAPLALGLAGLLVAPRRLWPFAAAAVLFLLVAMGDRSPLNVWRGALLRLPVFGSLRVPSRAMFVVVFCLAWAGARTVDRLAARCGRGRLRLVPWAVTGVVLLDLFLVCSPILGNAFVVPPIEVPRRRTFTMVRTTFDYCPPRGGDWKPPFAPVYPTYHAFLANLGVVDSGPLRDDPGALPANAVFCARGGDAEVTSFTPNRVAVRCRLEEGDELMLNQNGCAGWVAGGGETVRRDGLVGVRLPAGRPEASFAYRPWSVWVGALLSGALLPAAGVLAWRRRRV
jgi:hypothetical protein